MTGDGTLSGHVDPGEGERARWLERTRCPGEGDAVVVFLYRFHSKSRSK